MVSDIEVIEIGFINNKTKCIFVGRIFYSWFSKVAAIPAAL